MSSRRSCKKSYSCRWTSRRRFSIKPFSLKTHLSSIVRDSIPVVLFGNIALPNSCNVNVLVMSIIIQEEVYFYTLLITQSSRDNQYYNTNQCTNKSTSDRYSANRATGSTYHYDCRRCRRNTLLPSKSNCNLRRPRYWQLCSQSQIYRPEH